MTAFHVIAYPARDILEEYASSTKLFSDLVPLPVADKMAQLVLRPGPLSFPEAVNALEHLLFEYDDTVEPVETNQSES